MSIQSRLAALERVAAQRARQQVDRICGVFPIPDSSGDVFMCWDIPCDRILQGLVEFAECHRQRATCPDADICEYASVCHAGE